MDASLSRSNFRRADAKGRTGNENQAFVTQRTYTLRDRRSSFCKRIGTSNAWLFLRGRPRGYRLELLTAGPLFPLFPVRFSSASMCVSDEAVAAFRSYGKPNY